MINKGLMTSNKQDYETDIKLVNIIKSIYDIDLDLCASRNNICDNYFTKEDNALTKDLSGYKCIYCNPPYNKQRDFIKYLNKYDAKYIALLPARTDTKLFHEELKGSKIIFLKGRLKFNTNKSAPFPSMLVIRMGYNPHCILDDFYQIQRLIKLLKENNYL